MLRHVGRERVRLDRANDLRVALRVAVVVQCRREVLLDFRRGHGRRDDGLELVYGRYAAHALDEVYDGLEGLRGGLEARLDL